MSGTFNGKDLVSGETTTDVEALLNDKRSNVRVIASNMIVMRDMLKWHSMPASMFSSKNLFCLTHEELLELEESTA